MRLLCLLLLFATASAKAQAVPVEFGLLDVDGDGYVTLAEAAGNAHVVTRFDRADRNHDGRLSAREFARLERMKVRTVKARPDRIRAKLARDVRAVAREAESAPSAAAGGTATRASP